MSETPPEEKLDFKKILPVFVIILIDILGLTIILPILPLYAVSFGANAITYGLLSAAYPLMQFVGAPILGRLSDRYGRKPVLIVSQIGTFIGFLVMGFAHTLVILFLARIIDGISGANLSTAQAVITDSTTEKTRTQGLGLIGAAFGLGFIIGPIIAFIALAISDNNYVVPAFMAAGFSFASIMLSLFWLEETHPKEARQQTAAKKSPAFGATFAALGRPGVGILLILMFAQQLAFGGFEVIFAFFTLDRLGLDASGNAGLFVFAGLLIVLVQGYFIGKWSRKIGDRRLIILGLAGLAFGLIWASFTPRQPIPSYSESEMIAKLASSDSADISRATVTVDLPSDANKGWEGFGFLMAAMIPISIAAGVLQPGISSLITKRVAPDEVGMMLGISTSFYSAANAVTPLLVGLLFEVWGSGAPFLAGGILLAGLFVASLAMLKPGQEEHLEPGLARGGGH